MTGSTEPKSDTRPLATAPLLGARPLVQGENLRSYDQLLERICATLQPRDSLEEIWVRDIVDLVWEGFRLRRAKALLMTDGTHTRVKWQLDYSSHRRAAEQIARNWAAGDENATEQVTKALASAGMSIDMLLARAMSTGFDAMERIDRMLVSLEGRRRAALRELDLHRGPLAQKLRLAIAKAEEAERVTQAPPLAAAQPA